MGDPRLKKRFGQHHLVDGALCRPLLDFLEPAAAPVLEIGPGGGVLTGELLARGGRLLAVELDPEWAFELRRRLPGARTVIADALDWPWERLPGRWRVAGNLPYAVATAIIQRLLPHHQRIDRAAFLIQKEVADRLTAAAGDRPYGSTSVLVQARAKVRLLGRVRPGSFRPPPKVQSAFVGLELQPPPLPEAEMPAFTRLVRQAFAQRRKTVRNSLSAWDGDVSEALEAAGIDPRRRAETLDQAAFLRLHRALDPASAQP